jgi:hypothetical protein
MIFTSRYYAKHYFTVNISKSITVPVSRAVDQTVVREKLRDTP